MSKVSIESNENNELKHDREEVERLCHLFQVNARYDEKTRILEFLLEHEQENGREKVGKMRYDIQQTIA